MSQALIDRRFETEYFYSNLFQKCKCINVLQLFKQILLKNSFRKVLFHILVTCENSFLDRHFETVLIFLFFFAGIWL